MSLIIKNRVKKILEKISILEIKANDANSAFLNSNPHDEDIEEKEREWIERDIELEGARFELVSLCIDNLEYRETHSSSFDSDRFDFLLSEMIDYIKNGSLDKTLSTIRTIKLSYFSIDAYFTSVNCLKKALEFGCITEETSKIDIDTFMRSANIEMYRVNNRVKKFIELIEDVVSSRAAVNKILFKLKTSKISNYRKILFLMSELENLINIDRIRESGDIEYGRMSGKVSGEFGELGGELDDAK